MKKKPQKENMYDKVGKLKAETDQVIHNAIFSPEGAGYSQLQEEWERNLYVESGGGAEWFLTDKAHRKCVSFISNLISKIRKEERERIIKRIEIFKYEKCDEFTNPLLAELIKK